MTKIDKHWLKAKLDSKRGLQKLLADYMKLSPDMVSKMASGGRKIKDNEIYMIGEFFENLPSVEQSGLTEMALEVSTFDLLKNLGAEPKASASANDIKIGIHGRYAQIVATIDSAGIEQLRKKLDAIEMLLDAPERIEPHIN